MQHNINWDDPVERGRLAARLSTADYNAAALAHRAKSVIETRAGHGLRYVGSRFGRLVAVGETGRAFSTIEQARDWADKNPVTA